MLNFESFQIQKENLQIQARLYLHICFLVNIVFQNMIITGMILNSFLQSYLLLNEVILAILVESLHQELKFVHQKVYRCFKCFSGIDLEISVCLLGS